MRTNRTSTRTLRTMTRTLRAFSSAIFLLLGCLMLCAATALAAPLTGTVTDRTTGKPSAGDTIAVINTAQSMNELAKTTSDAQGRFHVNAPDGGQTLLHVTHRGAEYFKSVTPGASSVEIDVYDSAAKIDGISGEALVLSLETDASGKTLQGDENFGVMNASAPPRTEVGGNTFDFYLPKGATIVQAHADQYRGEDAGRGQRTLCVHLSGAPRRDALPGGLQHAVQRQTGVLAEALRAHRRRRGDAAEDDAVPGTE
jgi:5-hydroxyisourate hydrolase-like protein (transthyretin family)